MERTQILYLAIEIAAIQTKPAYAGSNPRKTLSPRRRTQVCVAAISNRQGLMLAKPKPLPESRGLHQFVDIQFANADDWVETI